MPRRHILSARQRSALLDLPTDEASLLRHYILADDDLIHVDRRRRPENRIGFALQLCALRYPGRMLAPGEVIPLAASAFLGAQLGIAGGGALILGVMLAVSGVGMYLDVRKATQTGA